MDWDAPKEPSKFDEARGDVDGARHLAQQFIIDEFAPWFSNKMLSSRSELERSMYAMAATMLSGAAAICFCKAYSKEGLFDRAVVGLNSITIEELERSNRVHGKDLKDPIITKFKSDMHLIDDMLADSEKLTKEDWLKKYTDYIDPLYDRMKIVAKSIEASKGRFDPTIVRNPPKKKPFNE